MAKGKQLGLRDAKTVWNESRVLNALQPIIARHQITAKRTALLVLDMNYVSAHRDFGIGPRLKLTGLSDAYFDRIDNQIIPNIQILLNFRQSVNPAP